jgi:arylsulfatase A-like enzyme
MRIMLERFTRTRFSRRALVALLLAPVVATFIILPGRASEPPPNILFVIMDDVGMDQMEAFGYGHPVPPRMPTIGQVANAGVRFRNTWAMPACTTSRSVFFTGRFPLRTNVFGALGPGDLANSHVSPYEITVPKLLKQRGYQSALFGKFHLALQGNSPYGYSMVSSLGWDYFYGWLDPTGDPPSIDTTAGGVAKEGRWSCGFVASAAKGGADEGACYAADGTCQEMTTSGAIPPGRTCRDAGGIFDPDQRCKNNVPTGIDFTRLSGHYVSPLDIDHGDGTVEKLPPTDIRARTYRGTSVVDAAIDWIKQQPGDKPWMATVSFASAHTPIMHPPRALLSAELPEASDFDCSDDRIQRALTNHMIEAMDTEIGRLLIDTGLATRASDGSLVYRPDGTNTMVVILGDNGSLGTTVKPDFDASRAKGTAYQTGVWVPLVVAGPLVARPNREVRHMVNIADLYELFGEIAGIDVAKSVPRRIDSVAMLPYLTTPKQKSIRSWNFTQIDTNIQKNDTLNAPCTIGITCTQIPVSKEVCEDNGGVWWGKDSTVEDIPSGGLTRCCDVNQFLHDHADPLNPPRFVTIQPLSSIGIRNDSYKIVQNHLFDYNPVRNRCEDTITDEFYQIDEAVPPALDRKQSELTSKGPLTPEQQRNYDALHRQLTSILASAPDCHGDGNSDGVVDDRDIEQWAFFAAPDRGKSSWYDFNHDGLTDSTDLQTIFENFGKCHKRP